LTITDHLNNKTQTRNALHYFKLDFVHSVGTAIIRQQDIQALNLTGRSFNLFEENHYRLRIGLVSRTGHICVNIEFCIYNPEEGGCRSTPKSSVLSVSLAVGLSAFILLVVGLTVCLYLKRRRQISHTSQKGEGTPTMSEMQDNVGTLEEPYDLPYHVGKKIISMTFK